MSVPDRLSEFLGSPSTQPPLSSSSSTNPSQSSSQSSSSSPSISIREDQIENAIAFLQHASVANSPLEQRLAFLRRKGLTQAEIDVALQRTRPSALLVQAPPPPPPSSSSPLQQQQYYQQQMQFVPQRTPRRASSLSSWLWFAIAAAGVGGVLAIAFRAVWNAIFVAERARKSRRKAVKDGGQISDSDNDDAVAGNRGSESDDDDAVDDVIDDDEDDDISDKGPTAKSRRQQQQQRSSSRRSTPSKSRKTSTNNANVTSSASAATPSKETLREQLARHEKSLTELSASIKKPDAVTRTLSQSATRDDIADLRAQITSLASSISRSQVTSAASTPAPSPYSTPWVTGPPAWQQQQLQQSTPLPAGAPLATPVQRSLSESAPPAVETTESTSPTKETAAAASTATTNVVAPEFDSVVSQLQQNNGATAAAPQPTRAKKPWESK